MKRVKEVLRLAHEPGCSNRQIQDSVRLGRTTVSTYLSRARNAGVRYADVAEMREATLEGRCLRALSRPQPDWSGVAAEMCEVDYAGQPSGGDAPEPGNGPGDDQRLRRRRGRAG